MEECENCNKSHDADFELEHWFYDTWCIKCNEECLESALNAMLTLTKMKGTAQSTALRCRTMTAAIIEMIIN